MAFRCPFPEAGGQPYQAGSREAFRRHLTIHHGRDLRRMPGGTDVIVVPSPSELTDRKAAIKRSQRHKKPRRAVALNQPPPLVCPPPTPGHVRAMSSVPVLTADLASPPLVCSGPPPIETAYSPYSDAMWADELQDSRPDSPFDLGNDLEYGNPWAFLDCDASLEAEATPGLTDPLVVPPSVYDEVPPPVVYTVSGTEATLGLPIDSLVAPSPRASRPSADAQVQTTDPRVIAPTDYITYRQSFDTLVAANHIALLVRASTSVDATAIADQTAIRLGIAASDQPSWDALYRMAITAVVVERHLQLRLAEMLAASTADRSGTLAVASVLIEMQARQRRPWDVADLPQPGDSHVLPALLPPDDVIFIE